MRIKCCFIAVKNEICFEAQQQVLHANVYSFRLVAGQSWIVNVPDVQTRASSPIVDSRPPTRAVVDSDGEDAEEEEEAGHPEANLVDGRVAHQDFTVLPSVQLLAHVAVERHLTTPKPQTQTQSDHAAVRSTNTRGRRKRPNNIHSERHACEGAEREHRQQQQPPLSPRLAPFLPPIWTGC